jgi:hypothetical protein
MKHDGNGRAAVTSLEEPARVSSLSSRRSPFNQTYVHALRTLHLWSEKLSAAEIEADGPGANEPTGGGSDDIGDVTWAVPTVTLNYPSNIPGGPGHNWASSRARRSRR